MVEVVDKEDDGCQEEVVHKGFREIAPAAPDN